MAARDDVLRHVGFGCLSGPTVEWAAVAKASRREGFNQYVADDRLSDEHLPKLLRPAAQAALVAGSVNWSGLPVVHVRPTGFSKGFFLTLTPDSVRESIQIRLQRGGQDFARVEGRR